MLQSKLIKGLLGVALTVSSSSITKAADPTNPPWDPAVPQVNISGATLFASFFKAPGSTNDFIDLDNDGYYRFAYDQPGYVDQLAKTWSSFTSNPEPTSLIVNYRGVGSGNGFAELLQYQAVQKASPTAQSWFPITNYGGSTRLSNYGILPTNQPSDNGESNRGTWSGKTGITWSGPYANASGIPIRQTSIDIGVMDVPTTWFVTNTNGTASWNASPTSNGYGSNPLTSWNTSQGQALESLTVTLVNPNNPSQSETVTFNTNTSNPNSNTVFDTPLAYVPIGVIANRGVNQQNFTATELQYLFTTGRMPNGENLVAATRDSGSGTRNGAMNSLGIDPSWGRGENMDDITSDKVNAPKLGALHQVTNLGSSSIMTAAVSNNRLAVGYNGLESTVASVISGSASVENISVMNNHVGGTQYVTATLSSIVHNGNVNTGWRMGGMETMATIGDPLATAHTPTVNAPGTAQGVAPALAGNGNPQMQNTSAALYIRNLLESMSAFTSNPTGDTSWFMPGELLATSFFMPQAMDALPGLTSGTAWDNNTANVLAALQSYTLANHYLGQAATSPKAYGTQGAGWVPERIVGTYEDGGTQNYLYALKTATPGVYTTGSLAGKSALNARNTVQGDFNGDGQRNINDIPAMVACIQTASVGGIDGRLIWAAQQQTMGNLSTLVLPHVLGDYNGDGNFNAFDLRYFADGLTINAMGKLDRAAAFTAIDNAAGGDFFGYSGNMAHGVYQPGFSFADLAGSDPTNYLLGATPGAGPNGADGKIDAYDVAYIFRVIHGAIGAASLGITANDSNGDGLIDWYWGNLDEAVFMDLSCDLNQDGYLDKKDADYLVMTVLGTFHGDGNFDGKVDLADYTVWADGFGITNALLTQGDFNGDGKVDLADYTVWADNFGSISSVSSVLVPEPGMMTLLVMGGAMLLKRRRMA